MDLVELAFVKPRKKKPKRSKWEFNKVYQECWAKIFSWFEHVSDKFVRLRMVKCTICSAI